MADKAWGKFEAGNRVRFTGVKKHGITRLKGGEEGIIESVGIFDSGDNSYKMVIKWDDPDIPKNNYWYWEAQLVPAPTTRTQSADKRAYLGSGPTIWELLEKQDAERKAGAQVE